MAEEKNPVEAEGEHDDVVASVVPGADGGEHEDVVVSAIFEGPRPGRVMLWHKRE